MTGKLIPLLFVLLCAPAQAAPDTPRNLADIYLQAVLDADWDTARSLWCETDRAAAHRLDIRYREQPFKLDSASLLVLERERCRSGAISATIEEVIADDTGARIRYRLRTGSDTAPVDYRATPNDDGWTFVKPETVLSAQWPILQTEFVELHVQPTRSISRAAMDRLDRFVAETCDRLAVAPERVSLLRENKLGYVFCDEETVAEIVGVPTAGIALLQTDTVITSEPCHLHELAHLLVNFALGELPLYTLPVMQEGAAVALGGRWGRTPAVMQALGRFTLAEHYLELESLLTRDGFYTESADLTYAPSGLWSGYLMDELGGETYLSLYRDLSGDLDTVRGFDQPSIMARIERAAGQSWTNLITDFATHLDTSTCGGIGTPAVYDDEPIVHVVRDGLSITVHDNGSRLRWVLEAETMPCRGALLLRGTDLETTSRLFTEQFPGRTYSGERLALVFSPEEIGVYDFHTDLLMVKFVAGFCPDMIVATDDGHRLEFTTGSDLLPSGPWNFELVCDADRSSDR